MKLIKRILYNLVFYSDFRIWIKVIKFTPKNSLYNWRSGILELYFLRKIIKLKNPKMVLELGAGIGVSSEAILDQIDADSKFVTVENNKKCLEILGNRLEKYKKNYEIISDKVVISKDKVSVETMIYEISKKLDVSKFDLIYIDGPSWTFVNSKFISGIPRGDIFYFYENLKKGAIVVLDGSYVTRKLIHRFCKSIKFLGIFKSFSFYKTENDSLQDQNLARLKKWKFID